MKLLWIGMLYSLFCGQTPPAESNKVLQEITELDKKYAERKQNMTLKLQMKVVPNCQGAEVFSETITYHYGKNKLRAYSANWEVILDGDYYVYADHVHRNLFYGYQSSEGEELRKKLGAMENLQEYVEQASRSNLDTLESGLYKLTFWHTAGEFQTVEMIYDQEYRLKSINMEAQKSFVPAPTAGSYCIQIQLLDEHVNKTSKKEFTTSEYFKDIKDPSSIQETYSSYHIHNQTSSQ